MMRTLLALAGFLALTLGVAAVGGWLTALGMPTWYVALELP